MNRERHLFYDIECTGMLAWVYGMYDTNVIHEEVAPIIFSFSYCWYDNEKSVEEQVLKHHQIKMKFQDLFNGNARKAEKEILKVLWKLQDEADIVSGYNSGRFDDKMVNGAYLRHKMGLPSPFKSLDVLKMTRVVKYPSHSLDYVSKALGHGGKSDVRHGTIWRDFVSGKLLARKQMKEYNNRDITELLHVYLDFRPSYKSHPNMGVGSSKSFVCPKCGQNEFIQSRGTRKRGFGIVREYNCVKKLGGCGAWPMERLADKSFKKPELV